MLIGRKVTVLGGGIGGLAVAVALARRGASVTVLEQAEAIREVGAGLQISPNGVAVLKALGLMQPLQDTGLRANAVCLRDYRTAARVLRLDLSSPGSPYFFLHRADLLALLLDAARDAGVQISLLQQITDVTLTPDGATLTNAQGATRAAGLLIGADGLHSVLRPLLNAPGAPRFTGQVAWRALVPLDAPLPPEVSVFMGPGRHLVAYPLRDGHLLNIVAVEERPDWAAEGWSHRDSPASLRTAFAGFGGPVPGWLERVDEVFLWGLFRHPVAAHWHKGHAALLGDAAHPTLPFLAQGANLALEDAWVLAAALAAHDDDHIALSAYQATRRPRAERVIDAAQRNARNYHLRTVPVRRVAHTALRIAGRLAPARMLGRFDWLYHHDVTHTDP